MGEPVVTPHKFPLKLHFHNTWSCGTVVAVNMYVPLGPDPGSARVNIRQCCAAPIAELSLLLPCGSHDREALQATRARVTRLTWTTMPTR